MKIIGLAIIRRRRSHRELKDIPDQRLRHGIGLVTSDTPAAQYDVVKQHLADAAVPRMLHATYPASYVCAIQRQGRSLIVYSDAPARPTRPSSPRANWVCKQPYLHCTS